MTESEAAVTLGEFAVMHAKLERPNLEGKYCILESNIFISVLFGHTTPIFSMYRILEYCDTALTCHEAYPVGDGGGKGIPEGFLKKNILIVRISAHPPPPPFIAQPKSLPY